MPKIPNPRKGEPDKLLLLKADRDILANAGGLCERLRKLTTGFNGELAAEFSKMNERLIFWSQTEEQDLSKPF
jgi:hypothetical protein